MCKVINPIKEVVSVPVQLSEDTAKTQNAPVNKHRRVCRLLSDSEASNEFGSPSKSEKKILLVWGVFLKLLTKERGKKRNKR